MIERLVPDTVVVVSADADMWDPSLLLPEEAMAVRGAVDKRQRDHAAGRICARRALARLGYDSAPLLRSPNGAAMWPAGAVGSITHCEGYCAAAVGRLAHVRGIGIDAERNRPLAEGLRERICSPAEVRWLTREKGVPELNWDALFFSAKESVYKAWSCLGGGILDHHDVEVSFSSGEGTFSARILPDAEGLAPPRLEGRFAFTAEHVFTALILRSPASSPPGHSNRGIRA